MTKTHIAFGCDHAGLALKRYLMSQVKAWGYEVLDVGTHSNDSVNYADYGYQLAQSVVQKKARFGVAICGSGIGISIAANRFPEIRAALCHNSWTAEMARKHNDANIIALGARVVDTEVACDALKLFLNTAFEGGRHQQRINQLSSISTN